MPARAGRLGASDFERERALLELLVDRVIVTDGAVEIRYVFPTGPDGEREPFWRLRTDCLAFVQPLSAPLFTLGLARYPTATDRTLV